MFGRYLMNMRQPLSLNKLFHDMHQNQRGAKKILLNGNVLAAPTKNSHEQAHTLQKKYTISFGKMWLAGCSTRRLVSDWNLCFSCFPKKINRREH